MWGMRWWIVVLLLAWGAPAGAENFWRGLGTSEAQGERDSWVKRGNIEAAVARVLTMAHNMGFTPELDVPARAKRYARRALDAYEKALSLGGPDADLHYRALVMAWMYLDEPRIVVRHVEGLREADARDPRDLLATSHLVHALAKLAGQGGPGAEALYQRTIEEYEGWFARVDEADPSLAGNLAVNHANAAEIMMAVGDLSGAIRHYRRSVELASGEYLPYYGLAVALDRDGQPASAKEAMRAALEWDEGAQALQQADDPDSPIYFVPRGDKFYYLGLALETEGLTGPAIAAYRDFLQQAQAARAEYRALARKRIEALGGKVVP